MPKECQWPNAIPHESCVEFCIIYLLLNWNCLCDDGSIQVQNKIIQAFNNWVSEAENDLHGKWMLRHLDESSIDIGDFPEAIEKFQKWINNETACRTRTYYYNIKRQKAVYHNGKRR